MTADRDYDIDLTGPSDANWMAAGRKGRQFEANRRRYWGSRTDVLDVFRDTYGPTDLAVIFKQRANRNSKVLLVQAKVNGKLKTKGRLELENFLIHKPEGVELRVEFLRDMNKSLGHTNTTYTSIKTVNHLDEHARKVKRLRDKE